jgi:hypothetical protein
MREGQQAAGLVQPQQLDAGAMQRLFGDDADAGSVGEGFTP